MRRLNTWVAGILAVVLIGFLAHAARAEVKVVVNHNANGETNADFKFKEVPSPSKTDAATNAKFTIVDGEADPAGGGLEKLNDGKVPTEEDQPLENFFFNAGTEGGRIGVALEKAIEIKQVNTYSWHPNTRGPQLYKLYASDGSGGDFNAAPKKGTDLEKAGWKLIASVDTRPKDGEVGGQYGVSISDSQGTLGKYKYLLVDCSRTETDDDFGNTFYSEIDVIEQTTGNRLADPGTGAARAEVKVVVNHNANGETNADFKFKEVPSPSKADAATHAKFTIVDGEADPAGGGLEKLNDGKVPTEEDQPLENFFFNAGTEGGRIGVALEKAIDIKQVNTYSWHPNTRGPQLYKLYASDGSGGDFNATPKKGTDPEKAGWKLIAAVDTRPKDGEVGGQYGVSISDSQGALGKYKYLLFDCSQTESDDGFGNTFYSEIDVIDQNAAAAAASGAPVADASAPSVFKTPDGKYEFTIDSSQAPDMKEWADTKLAPVMADWYPKIVQMLPSEGYSSPARFSLQIQNPGNGVAATGGTRIMCNASWMRRNEKGESIGAIVHEMVHVVQQYGRARRTNPNASRNPGWLVEGIADYIRWFKYEPQSHGADLRDASRAKYDGSYRITANFLNWASDKYEKDLVRKLNADMREGNYSEDLWKKYTGKTVEELGEEWKQGIAAGKPNGPILIDKPAEKVEAGPDANKLSDAEVKEGWKLLFDGKSLDGWHSFHRDNVRPGWKVQDGTLACVDPHNAGDLCTNDKFDWFELQLDYNITHAGNSGIMYHVTDKGGAVWATGPEFQLEDNTAAADPIRCGWLYALYQPPIDPATGKILDATKPVGEWNHVRLLMTPEKCVHEINGVKYFEYVLNSDDFKQRVARSKFARMPDFAKSDIGYIALQGDHGAISFRNIKVKPIESKPKE